MHMDEQKVYIKPSDENGAALFRRQIAGNVVMLNLLRFRTIADYTEFPQLALASRRGLNHWWDDGPEGWPHRFAVMAVGTLCVPRCSRFARANRFADLSNSAQIPGSPQSK